MKRATAVAAVLQLLQHASGQAPPITVTIGVPYCSTNSAPFPSLIPGYSSTIGSYGSMSSLRPSSQASGSLGSGSSSTPSSGSNTPGVSITTISPGTTISGGAASSIPSSGSGSTPQFETTSTLVNLPAATASAYFDQYGQTYRIHTNIGASGNTIHSAASGYKMKRRGFVTPDELLEECIETCSLTPACVAMFSLGSSCLLYSSVNGTMFLVGGVVGFNTQRFTGFGNEAAPESSIAASSSNTLVPLSQSSGAGTLQTSTMRASTLVATSQAPGTTSTIESSSGVSTTQAGIPSSAPSYGSSSAVVSSPPIMTASGTPSWWSDAPSSTLSFLTPVVTSSSSPSSSELVQSRSITFSSTELAEPSPRSSLETLRLSSTADTSSGRPSTSITFAWMSTVIVTPAPSSLVPSAPTSPADYSTPLSSAIDSEISTSEFSSTPIPDMSTSSLVDSSTFSSSAAMPTSTIPTFACPENNGTVVTDVNSIQYYLMCESDISGNVFSGVQATSSFNDCLGYCDSAVECTGFSYSGMANGAGAGNCYLKNGAVSFVTSDEMHVAAIRWSPFPPASSLEALSSTTSSALVGPSALTSTLQVTSSEVSSVASNATLTSSSDVNVSTPASASPTPSGNISPDGTCGAGTGFNCYGADDGSCCSPYGYCGGNTDRGLYCGDGCQIGYGDCDVTTTTSSSAVAPSTPEVPSSRTSTTRTTTTTTTTTSRSSTSSTRSSISSSSSSTQLATSTPTPVFNNGKRGLTYTNATLTLPYLLSGQNSRVSWGYNWYYSRYTDAQNTTNPAIKFIPLLFSDDPALLRAWPAAAQAAIDAGADALMSFNEPDLCVPNSGAACMTVNASVTAFKSHMQPFAGVVPLGAPAVTDGGGLEWLHQFMGNCTGCTIDFISLHWYSNVYAFSYLQYYVQRAYSEFGLPIWVTEFGMDGSSYNTDPLTQSFLQQALPWLDAVPYVQRYAWFINGPGYLINANGSGLSAQGMIYNSYTAPCANWTNIDGHC